MKSSVISERRLLFLLGTVQFVNVLDFMMVMPLGPDFSRGLGIPVSHLGWIGGSYTAAAAIAGVAGAAVLDRFDRRNALACAMLGLAVGTFLGGFATGLGTLLAARVLAGAFGGPATSLSLAIIADAVPPERRGRAMGAVLGAFSVAAVLGVPVGLEVARIGGWRLPFFGVGCLSILVSASTMMLMPSLREHLQRAKASAARSFGSFIRDPAVLTSLFATAAAMGGGFALIPNLSTYFQHNLGYPRERLGLLYFIGGIISFAAMRVGGRCVDRYGAVWVATAGSLLMIVDLIGGFFGRLLFPPLAVFVGFMLANSLRAVASSSLSSRVPFANERARFMSTQAAIQHLASSFGAIFSSVLLSERPDGSLVGMRKVATFSLVLATLLPLLVFSLARQVRAREMAAPRAPA